jgi:AcrR family transcriptional regulator
LSHVEGHLAAEIGISKTTTFKYFCSKEELNLAVQRGTRKRPPRRQSPLLWTIRRSDSVCSTDQRDVTLTVGYFRFWHLADMMRRLSMSALGSIADIPYRTPAHEAGRRK